MGACGGGVVVVAVVVVVVSVCDIFLHISVESGVGKKNIRKRGKRGKRNNLNADAGFVFRITKEWAIDLNFGSIAGWNKR